MRDKSRWLVVCRKCWSISRVCGEYTDYTRSYHHPGAQFWVGSSRNRSVFPERPNTGRHEKAPVCCPCNRLAALHGSPRTLVSRCRSGPLAAVLDIETVPLVSLENTQRFKPMFEPGKVSFIQDSLFWRGADLMGDRPGSLK